MCVCVCVCVCVVCAFHMINPSTEDQNVRVVIVKSDIKLEVKSLGMGRIVQVLYNREMCVCIPGE